MLNCPSNISTSKQVTNLEITLLIHTQPDSETQLLTIQFEWNGVLKSVSSTLVGVSPEFELALYTMCFFMGREENHIQLGPYNVNVKCYRLGNNRIGSAFPIAESWNLSWWLTKYLLLAQYCIELLILSDLSVYMCKLDKSSCDISLDIYGKPCLVLSENDTTIEEMCEKISSNNFYFKEVFILFRLQINSLADIYTWMFTYHITKQKNILATMTLSLTVIHSRFFILKSRRWYSLTTELTTKPNQFAIYSLPSNIAMVQIMRSNLLALTTQKYFYTRR